MNVRQPALFLVAGAVTKSLLVFATFYLWRPAQICAETVRLGKTSNGLSCQADRSTLKSSSLASIKVNFWKVAVGRCRRPSQGLKVPFPGIFLVGVAVSADVAVVVAVSGGCGLGDIGRNSV